MGNTKSIPVVGEAVTVTESACKITGAGVCALVGNTRGETVINFKIANDLKKYNFIYQKALMLIINIVFKLQINFCDITTHTHKFERLFWTKKGLKDYWSKKLNQT